MATFGSEEQAAFDRLVEAFLHEKDDVAADFDEMRSKDVSGVAKDVHHDRERIVSALLKTNRDGFLEAMGQCSDSYVRGSLQAMVEIMEPANRDPDPA